jgi:tetratricopeptide (TPR) repeat protein
VTRRTRKPLKVFCSYSHRDEHYLEVLKTWLVGLERDGLIEEWHDRMISAGGEWEEAIAENLETSDMVFLLVTPDFMASQYIYEKEISRAVEKHRRGEVRVIPIIVRPSPPLRGTPFGKLQALPKDGKPITTWPNQDEAWLDVLTGIQQAVAEISFNRQAPGQEESSEQIYREAVEWAWTDGELHSREVDRLSDLAGEYELSTTSASAIERQVMGDTKEAILERQAREEEERQGHLEGLYSRARRLHQNRQWQVVIEIFEEIHSEEPDYPDPEGLFESARQALDTQLRAAALYDRGVQHADTKEWQQAIESLEEVRRLEPGYQDTETLLAQVRREMERQNRLDELYAQARRLHRAQEWQQVVSVFDQIRELDPSYTDPEELLLSDREALASKTEPLSQEREILPQQHLTFEEADRRFAELWQGYYAGTLSAEQYDAQVRQLMLQDAEGRWWAKTPETGEWNRYDGHTWIQDTPPADSLQEAEPSGSTPFVDSLTQICSKYAGLAYYVGEAISKEQLTNARSGLLIAGTERVIALLDATRGGSNKRGLAICESGLRWRNNETITRAWTATAPQSLSWNDFRNASIKRKRKGLLVTGIEIGEGNVFFMLNSSMNGDDLVQLLLEIQSFLRAMSTTAPNTGV